MVLSERKNMGKRLFIAEKPSVAKEFARVMQVAGAGKNGYMESDDTIVTWCVGHLVTMSYPDAYDPGLKKWSAGTLPFLPEQFLYEVIPGVKKQFDIVAGLLNRSDVDTIYICTDSGREGEYIYRLVDQMAKVPDSKTKLRVWIDSQTEEEILRGVREARPMQEYDNLSCAAYLRAKEDYLMGINFSRILSVLYGNWLNDNSKEKKWTSISVGRVMTCVLGMVMAREQEIRSFVKIPFYRVLGHFSIGENVLDGEWRFAEGSAYTASQVYKENGFRDKKDAEQLIENVTGTTGVIKEVTKKKEKKNPPLLFNLAELQNLSSKLFKISPDETLQIVQDLYERKLVTYPRTDARVLSTAVAKEIGKNLNGLRDYETESDQARSVRDILSEIAAKESYKGLEKTRYVNDKKITDHYAIIPTGAGIGGVHSLSDKHQKMYEVIVRRFLSIFFPPAVYRKLSVVIECACQSGATETFATSTKVLVEDGFLPVNQYSFTRSGESDSKKKSGSEDEEGEEDNPGLRDVIDELKKGLVLPLSECEIREGETTPPKRYNSGSMILAMENAGQLIEDEDLRAQIKGSGIGTSATRAEILKKLFNIGYLRLDKKTQIITPTLKGELVYGVVGFSMPSMLSPKMTASWEMGLTQVADGKVSEEEYIEKLNRFIGKNVEEAKKNNITPKLQGFYRRIIVYYDKKHK